MDNIWEYAVLSVHWVKGLFATVESHHIWGIPLDLPFRFFLLAFLYCFAARRWTRARAVGICLVVLVGKEAFDVFAVRSIHRVHWPMADDLLDLLSGFLGMGLGEGLTRWLPTPSQEEKAG